MCRLILIAANHPLPPTASYEDGLVFSGRSITENEGASLASTLRLVGRRHAVVVAAHQGCGCGFAYADEYEQSCPPRVLASLQATPDQLASYLSGHEGVREDSLKGRRSVRALREYLALAAADGPVELFVGWDGVWPPERDPPHLHVDPGHFADDLSEFSMETWTHFTVVLGSPTSDQTPR